MGAEPQQSSKVCRHCMVGKEARDDLLEPLPLFGDRPVHTPSQFPFDLLEFRCHAIAPGLPMDQERASTCRAADQSKAQEVEGLRFAKPALLSLGRRMAANSISRVLSGCSDSENSCNRSRIASQKRRASLSCSKPTTRSSAYRTMIMSPVASPSPAFGPKIEGVVKVDVGEER